MNLFESTAEMLLKAMYHPQGKGVTQQFLFGDIGAAHWEKRLGASIHYDEKQLLKTVLHVRREGPIYLRKTPPDQIRSMLLEFVSDHYTYLADDAFFHQFSTSYFEQVSEHARAKFTGALAQSRIFLPKDILALFPIDIIRVQDSFDSQNFFLIDSRSLNASRLPKGVDHLAIEPCDFPPLRDWDGRRWHPRTWLGIRSPSLQTSQRMKAAILGAVSLTPNHRNRYMCSERSIPGGWCTLDDSISFGLSEPSTPPLVTDVVLSVQDHDWLTQLSVKLGGRDKTAIREIRALEYFYRAWFMDSSERYPSLYMSLESIFGDANRATQAVIDGIRSLLGEHIPEARVRSLSDLRAAVIHGGAPEVYDSRTYARYYSKYEADPIDDLGILVAECLRKRIFGNSMYEKADPHAEFIEKAIESGQIPRFQHRTILDLPSE
jgi:hypothetical protein